MKHPMINCPQGQRRRGSVLIVVLWASFGLVAVSLLFGHSMLMSYRGADNDLAGRQAEQAIEGAIRYAESLLVEQETPGLLPDPLLYTSENAPAGEATFWFLGRAANETRGTLREYGLVDEAAKLNLNTVTPAILASLANTVPDITDDLAAAIIEWRDANAAASTSSGGVTGTNVKHAPFESVEELALISGMTREILYGEDANMNGVLDPNEDDGDKTLPADNRDGKLDPGLIEYFTVFTSEPDKDSSGNDLFNLAPAPGGSAPTTTELQTALETAGVTDAAVIAGNLGGGPLPASVLELLVRGNVSADDEPKVVAAVRGASVTGLINVNTASEAVLACIPGIAAKAPDVVTARLTRATQSASMLWLKDVLDPAEIVQAGPFVTGRSFQVTADIAAVGRHGRGYRRVKVVIDNNPHPPAAASTTTTTTAATTSAITPRVIYRRNLSPLGWALGADVRKELALKKEVR
jgi:type II secretory pathway component PulK